VCGTGGKYIWLGAFLGGLGANDFRLITQPRACRHAQVTGICLGHALRTVHHSCPLEWLTFPTASPHCSLTMLSGAGISDLLSIAYDYDVLGLGPD
jgi:hypothetical protein